MLSSSPSFSSIVLAFDLASTFSLNCCGSVLHRCIGMAYLGLIVVVASAASVLSIVYLSPVGRSAASMWPSCFISGMRSVSPA